ncbi:MAG TPA: hypothetical protein VNX15_03815 [Gemmatimonadales bacterium]|jgi:hypothetical protein|nr:hypothetical protein [Gemmatimonadales bacterium]
MIAHWLPLWSALSWQGAALPVRQAPDSALLRRFREAVNAASDTLDALRGLTQAFRTDLPTASPTLVLARATSVHDACASGASAVRRLQGILAARTVSDAAARSQAAFRTTAEETVAALDRCVRTWLPLPRTDERSDSLRAWGPYRIAQLDQSLRRYDAARFVFAKAAGLTPPPKNP